VVPLREGVLQGASYRETEQFRKQVEAFQREVEATGLVLDRGMKKIRAIKQAYFRMNEQPPELLDSIYRTEEALRELEHRLHGSPSKREVGEKTPPSPGGRLSVCRRGLSTTYGPAEVHLKSLEAGKKELIPIRKKLDTITGRLLPQLEKELRLAGAPWIEGSDPNDD
jgi:hypothetical protein